MIVEADANVERAAFEILESPAEPLTAAQLDGHLLLRLLRSDRAQQQDAARQRDRAGQPRGPWLATTTTRSPSSSSRCSSSLRVI